MCGPRDSAPRYAPAATASTISATIAVAKRGVSPRPAIELTPLVAALLSLHVSGGAAQPACQCVTAAAPQPEAPQPETFSCGALQPAADACSSCEPG